MSDIEFAKGIYFNKPHEKAPDFVLGSISVRPEVFVEWLQQQTPSDKGYVRLKVNVAKKSGEPYVALDTWEPKPGAQRGVMPDIDDDDIPF